MLGLVTPGGQMTMCGALPAEAMEPFSEDVDSQEHEPPAEREDQEESNATTQKGRGDDQQCA